MTRCFALPETRWVGVGDASGTQFAVIPAGVPYEVLAVYGPAGSEYADVIIPGLDGPHGPEVLEFPVTAGPSWTRNRAPNR